MFLIIKKNHSKCQWVLWVLWSIFYSLLWTFRVNIQWCSHPQSPPEGRTSPTSVHRCIVSAIYNVPWLGWKILGGWTLEPVTTHRIRCQVWVLLHLWPNELLTEAGGQVDKTPVSETNKPEFPLWLFSLLDPSLWVNYLIFWVMFHYL